MESQLTYVVVLLNVPQNSDIGYNPVSLKVKDNLCMGTYLGRWTGNIGSESVTSHLL
jgi:hypothetical protein